MTAEEGGERAAEAAQQPACPDLLMSTQPAWTVFAQPGERDPSFERSTGLLRCWFKGGVMHCNVCRTECFGEERKGENTMPSQSGT